MKFTTLDGVELEAAVINAAMIAAAGGHHMSIAQPYADRAAYLLHEILPDLTPEEAAEVAEVRDLAGLPVAEHPERPPFEEPHPTATPSTMVGHGADYIRPGAMPRANHGVLFLSHAPEFNAVSLDCLRQPLESGMLNIARATGSAQFPARFQLVLGMPACPCGGRETLPWSCLCTPVQVRRFTSRVSGPLFDRVDIRLDRKILPGVLPVDVATTRSIVTDARERAARRLAGTPWSTNAQVTGSWLRSDAGKTVVGAANVMDRALERGRITMRGYDRVLRMAWTFADLSLHERPTQVDVDQALELRMVQS
jgi:magnesium chelatase family protein